VDDRLQPSRDRDRIGRLRAEILEQHESTMELLSECALLFNGIWAFGYYSCNLLPGDESRIDQALVVASLG